MRGFCTRGCTPEEDPGSREIGGIGLSRSSGRTPSNLRLQQQRQAATVKATPPPMPPIAIPASLRPLWRCAAASDGDAGASGGDGGRNSGIVSDGIFASGC